MKKLLIVVLGFGMVSTSIASAAVGRASGLELALGEKQASQMNGRMLACGRPARMKSADHTHSISKSKVRARSASSALSAR